MSTSRAPGKVPGGLPTPHPPGRVHLWLRGAYTSGPSPTPWLWCSQLAVVVANSWRCWWGQIAGDFPVIRPLQKLLDIRFDFWVGRVGGGVSGRAAGGVGANYLRLAVFRRRNPQSSGWGGISRVGAATGFSAQRRRVLFAASEAGPADADRGYLPGYCSPWVSLPVGELPAPFGSSPGSSVRFALRVRGRGRGSSRSPVAEGKGSWVRDWVLAIGILTGEPTMVIVSPSSLRWVSHWWPFGQRQKMS